MRLPLLLALAAATLLPGARPLRAQDQVATIPKPRALSDDALVRRVKAALDGTLDPAGRVALTRDLLGAAFGTPDLQSDRFFAVVHLAQWGDGTAAGAVTNTIARQHWYVFRGGQPASRPGASLPGLRLEGASTVHVVYVALDLAQSVAETARYRVEVTKKTAAPVRSLQELVAFALTPGGGIAAVGAPVHWVGGGTVDVRHLPSDMKVRAQVATKGDQYQDASAETFDNEGLYRWDVSLAMPLSRLKQLDYAVEDGRVTAREVERDRLFALLNFYPWKTDVKRVRFEPPHLVAGVSLNKNPLDRWMVGGAVGLNLAQLFAGAAFTREAEPESLQQNAAATEAQLQRDLRRRYKPSFVIGLNAPVREVVAAIRGDQ